MTRRFVYPLQAVLVRATHRADEAATQVGAAQREVLASRDRLCALEVRTQEAWQALAPRPGGAIDPAFAGASARHMQRWMRTVSAAMDEVQLNEAALNEASQAHKRAWALQRGFEAHREEAGVAFAQERVRRELLEADDDWMLRKKKVEDDDAHR